MIVFRRIRLSVILSLLGLTLLGAGCAKQVTTEAPSALPTQKQGAVTPPSPVTAPTPAARPTPSPAPVATPENCPLTQELVKKVCKLSNEVTRSPYKCSFDVEHSFGKTKRKVPILQALIGQVWFKAPPGSDLGAVIDAQRLADNQAIESSGGVFTPCDRWESKFVLGVGDESIMVPLTLLGCDKSRVLPLYDLPKASSIYIKKGTNIAQVSSGQGDYGGNEGCSSEEIINIAKDYVVPAM